MPSFDPAVAHFIINTNANSYTNGNDKSNMNANVNGNGNLNDTANENGSVNGNANNDANANSNGNGTDTGNGSNNPNSTSANASPRPSHSSNNSHRGSGHNSPANRPIRPDRKNCAPTASNAQGLFPPAACVFVGKVPLEQQGKELEGKFSTIGPCYVKTNVDRKKELPSAFVQFEKSEHAETALTWHNTMQLHDRLLRVEVSKAIRTGIMGYRNGNSITLDAVREVLLGRGALDYCTTECTTSGITVSKVVFSFVGDYQDAMKHFQNNPDIYLKADYGIRPIYPPSPPPLPRYSQPQPSYYPPAPAPVPYTQVPYTQGPGTYPTGSYAQASPPPPPFPNYANWTYPQEQFPPQHYQWSYGQGTYPPYAQGSWCPLHWSEPPCHPEPPHHAAEAHNPNTHTQTLHPGMFFPPAPWSEEHYAATASQDPGSQSAQAQSTVSQSTQSANGNELTPPSSPEQEEKTTEEQGDEKTVIEESTEEKEEEKKEEEAENEKKDEKKWPLVVG